MRIYSYSRVSTGNQATRSGLDRQHQAAADYAKRVGGVLDNELDLTDAGRSAYKGKHLKGALGQFLDLANRGALGEAPHLVVEDLDRLSRLEPLEGLMDVLLALVRAGVTIHTTIDGATYSRERLAQDSSALLVLVVKAQAAHDYSKRLGVRVASAHQRKRDQIAAGKPTKIGNAPKWVDWTGDGYKLNEHADTVRRVFALSESGLGGLAIARRLNEDGVPTFGGRQWTGQAVNQLMSRPTVYGTLKSSVAGEMPGFYPQVVTEAQYQAAAARRRANAGRIGSSKQVKSLIWIGQGITRCWKCGNAAGVNSSSDKKGGRYYYIRDLTPNCSPGGWHVPEAQAYLLDRLTGAALRMLTTTPADTAGVERQLQDLEVEIQASTEALAQAESKVLAAATADVSITTVELLGRAVDAARKRQEDAINARDAAQLQLQTLATSEPVPDVSAYDLSTTEARVKFNKALRRWGLTIWLDRQENRWGLELPGREIVWAPYNDDWWLDFGWVGPPEEETNPPGWIPTEAEHQLTESRRQELSDEF